jgi:hypothetical protein
MALDYCGGSSGCNDRCGVLLAVGQAFHMSKPILVSLAVSIGCFVAAAGISSRAPHCEVGIAGHSECTIDRLPYDLPVFGLGVIGALIALVLFCYSITWGLERFDEWKNKS